MVFLFRMEVDLDSLSKKLLRELEEMQFQTGRMFRNMSITRMMSSDTGRWSPQVDIYESKNEFCVYVDIAGAERESLLVVASENQLRFSGKRCLPSKKDVNCVHQLEIELGCFDRTVSLSAYVEVDEVHSTYTDGILTVVLPKRKKKSKVTISISTGE